MSEYSYNHKNNYLYSDDDSLALSILAKLQTYARNQGVSVSVLSRHIAADSGVAAWDLQKNKRVIINNDFERGPGLPPGRDRPGPTRFDPRPGKRVLTKVISECGWSGKLAMAQVVVAWEKIVGEQIATHSQVVAFAEARIDLCAVSTAWAQQLRLMLPSIKNMVVNELQRLYPEKNIPAVEIRIYGPKTPNWKHGRFGGAQGGRGPRDTYA